MVALNIVAQELTAQIQFFYLLHLLVAVTAELITALHGLVAQMVVLAAVAVGMEVLEVLEHLDKVITVVREMVHQRNLVAVAVALEELEELRQQQ
jgi:hypothetical protein